MTVNRALYEPMAREIAAAHGVPPDLFAKQIETESGYDDEAYNAGSGASGLAQIVPAAHPKVNPWAPREALTYAAQWMAALHDQFGTWRAALAAYNWGPGNVQRYGLGAAPEETRRYWTAILGPGWPEPGEEAAPRRFDPDTSDEYQRQDWSCSIRTATWLLRSIGVDVTAGDMQDRMVAAGLVSSDVGLHDGSGSALAAWLTATFGVQATAVYPADWAEVKDYAGTLPIGLGGQRLNHWLAVRRPTAGADALDVMNPAPAWQSIGTALSRAEWTLWGPWAALYVAVPTEDGGDDLSAEERQELDDLRNYVGGLTRDVLPSALGTMEAAARASKGTRKALADVVLGQTQAIRDAAGIEA